MLFSAVAFHKYSYTQNQAQLVEKGNVGIAMLLSAFVT